MRASDEVRKPTAISAMKNKKVRQMTDMSFLDGENILVDSFVIGFVAISRSVISML